MTSRFKDEGLLTPGQVAARFAVDPKTVTRWAKLGKLPTVMTPGGHRRYPAALINDLCTERYETDQTSTPG